MIGFCRLICATVKAYLGRSQISTGTAYELVLCGESSMRVVDSFRLGGTRLASFDDDNAKGMVMMRTWRD